MFDNVLNTTLCQGNTACIEYERLLLHDTFNWITDQTSKETLNKVTSVFSLWSSKNYRKSMERFPF